MRFILDDNNNLFTKINIPISMFFLGGQIDLKDVQNNNLKVTIKSNQNIGDTIVLKNVGIPISTSNSNLSNIYVKLMNEVPETLTNKQKKLLEQLSKEGL
jgi:DnaJ-class molecular chaperone